METFEEFVLGTAYKGGATTSFSPLKVSCWKETLWYALQLRAILELRDELQGLVTNRRRSRIKAILDILNLLIINTILILVYLNLLQINKML